jgi:ribosome assembly protein 4
LHVSYSPDGKRLASGSGDTTVRFWNVSSSMPQHTCTGHKNHVLCTAWSPDGRIFVSSDLTGELRLWDPKTGAQKGILKGHTKWVTYISFEPMHANKLCERFATSSKDHTIKVWNTATQQCETTISGHTDSVGESEPNIKYS